MISMSTSRNLIAWKRNRSRRAVLCNIQYEVDALDTLLHDTRLNRSRMQGAVKIIQQMINREL